MRKRSYFWLASAVLSLLILVIFIWKGSEQDYGVFSPDLKKLKADLVLYGVKYRRDTVDSQAKWIVNANVARLFEKKKEIEFEKVKVFFSKSDEDSITVRAEKGKYDISSGVLGLFGDVVLTGLSGYSLYTDKMFYRPNKGVIEAPGKVLMTELNGNELCGQNMKYFLKEHRLLIYDSEVVIIEQDENNQ